MIFIVPPTKGGNGPQGPKCPHDCSILCTSLCGLFCKDVYYIIGYITPQMGQ